MGEVSPNFPKIQHQTEEDSPSKSEKESRVVALGGIRRVFRSRYGKAASKQHNPDGDDADEESVNSEDEEHSEREGRVIKPTKLATTSNHYTLNLASSTPTARPDLPYTLSGLVLWPRILCVVADIVHRYLQVFFNTSLCMVFLWLLLQFILTVQRDVQQRILEHSMGTIPPLVCHTVILTRTSDVVQEIKACSVLHKNNFCEGNIVPHMFQPCGEWETCMNRDPSKIGRARIGAQLLAEIVNAFVENISWKTFVSTLVIFQFLHGTLSKSDTSQFFSVVSLAFFTLFINSLFTFYRSKHHHTPHPATVPIPQPQFVMPPQTPRRGKSGPIWKPGNDGDDIGTPTRGRRLDDSTVARIKGSRYDDDA